MVPARLESLKNILWTTVWSVPNGESGVLMHFQNGPGEAEGCYRGMQHWQQYFEGRSSRRPLKMRLGSSADDFMEPYGKSP